MKRILLAMMALTACMLPGATINYSTTGAVGIGTVGNSIVASDGGVDVTASAWSVPTLGTSFEKARLRNYGSPGLGVCDSAEQNSNGTNCSSDSFLGGPSEHQVDNLFFDDFVMFQFSSGGNLFSVTNIKVVIHYLANDFDVSYYLGNASNTALDLTGINSDNNPVLAGFQNRVDLASGSIPAVPSSSVRTVNINNIPGYNTLIFGTKLNGINDGFKIKSISFDTRGPGTGTNENVPEPATMAMLGAGLLCLSFWRRKVA